MCSNDGHRLTFDLFTARSLHPHTYGGKVVNYFLNMY